MDDVAFRSDLLFGVLVLTAILAGCAIALAVIALRKNHYLIDLCEQLARRLNPVVREGDGHGAAVRVNLITLAILLLWISFLVCLAGLRVVLV